MSHNKRHIVLIGFSGCGKSTIAPELARKLKLKLIDTDQLIAKQEKKTISEIFKTDGERYFRAIESKVVEKIITNKKRTVVALGGGGFQKPANRKLILENALVIFLSCNQKELYNRLSQKTDRPLLPQSAFLLKEKIRRMLAKRINNYKKADLIVSTTDKTIREVVAEITGKIKNADY